MTLLLTMIAEDKHDPHIMHIIYKLYIPTFFSYNFMYKNISGYTAYTQKQKEKVPSNKIKETMMLKSVHSFIYKIDSMKILHYSLKNKIIL